MADLSVTWLFRKKRILGNFSIENSFTEVLRAWPNVEKPQWIEANDYSEGFSKRLNIIRDARKVQSDILHITGDIHFAALAWPKWRKNRPRVVLTIHDIGFLEESSGLKLWLTRKFWIHWPLRCVDHLIVVSTATKQSVLEEVPWFDESKISVVPTVIPAHFERRTKIPHNTKMVALHIGLAKNKNLKGHAKALNGLNVHLRIIGEPSKYDHKILLEQCIEYSWTSRLNNEEMQAEYANADLLLFASTLEGFGMPILEAQVVGLPVITSNISPMKEVAGQGAILVDPNNAKSIRAGINSLVENRSLVQELLSTTNPSRFKASTVARRLRDLYSQL